MIVFTVGFVDDVRGLTPGVKLVGQSIGALSACVGGLSIGKLYLPFLGTISLSYFAYPFTIFWFLLIINGFNLIDGMDGLVAVTSFVCSFFLLVLCLQNDRFVLALPAVIITGATLGFFHFNMNPAKVFIGDSGSYFLGYNLAALAIKTSTSSPDSGVNILVPTLIFALPITDSIMAIFRRLIRGQHVFCPDTDHIHHCLLRQGFNQNEVLFILCSITMITGLSGLILNRLSDWSILAILVINVIVLIFGGNRVGYLNCFSGTEICRFGNSWIKKALLKIEVLKLNFFIAKGRPIKALTPLLARIFELMELDYAALVVEFPPEMRHDATSFQGTIQRGTRPVDQQGLMSIKLPLYSGRFVYGELHVEKHMVTSNFSAEFIFSLINTISYIIVRKLKKLTYFESQYQPRRSTYILIPNRRLTRS